MSNIEVGQVIRMLRRQRGWSQLQLGGKCLLSQSAISRIETGVRLRPLSIPGRLRLAGAFGVLLDDIAPPRPPEETQPRTIGKVLNFMKNIWRGEK